MTALFVRINLPRNHFVGVIMILDQDYTKINYLKRKFVGWKKFVWIDADENTKNVIHPLRTSLLILSLRYNNPA